MMTQHGRGRGRGKGWDGGDRGKGRGDQGRGACMLCKEQGHWVGSFPKLEEAARRLN